MKSIALLCLFSLSATCFALEDTPENRSTEAARYLEVVPASEMFADVAVNMSKTMPEAQREKFIQIMKGLDFARLTQAMKDSMVKIFTADELKALADFYSSKEGKSAMKKMGTYMAELMPIIQDETRKAVSKLRETSMEKTPAEKR